MSQSQHTGGESSHGTDAAADSVRTVSDAASRNLATTTLPAGVLLLVPTELERRQLLASGQLPVAAEAHLCGFGPIAAAARTAQLIAASRPRLVLLVGIAGTYDPVALPVGQAAAFSEVAIDGVGAGEGPARLSAAELGFPQWPGDGQTPKPAATERLPLSIGAAVRTASGPDARTAGLLLTVCAASADKQQARERVRRFPGCVAEDMEAFGAALASHLAGVPLTVVRGIANRAGDRDTSRWQIEAALVAAARRAAERLAAFDPSEAPP